jgi:hypothetical protein
MHRVREPLDKLMHRVREPLDKLMHRVKVSAKPHH